MHYVNRLIGPTVLIERKRRHTQQQKNHTNATNFEV